MKTLVSIIIPNFNGLELLKICLPSLKKQTFKDFEIIVVDNGSSDGSSDYIKASFKGIRCIELKENFGFSKAVNIGIKRSNGKYIVLLNNDSEMDKECMKMLLKAAANHNEVGFVSAKILQFNNRNKIDNAGDYMDSSGHLLTRGFGDNEKLYKKGEYIFLGTGSGTLFKREVFDEVGHFDKDFFFYMEDADLCFRAQLAGFKGWFEPKAKIYHIRMATSSKYFKDYESLVFRNMTMMIIKNFPAGFLLHNFNWLKIILVHINTLKYLIFKGHILSTIKVEWYLVIHLRKILRKRKIIQALKKVSDKYIIENMVEKKFTVGKLFSL